MVAAVGVGKAVLAGAVEGQLVGVHLLGQVVVEHLGEVEVQVWLAAGYSRKPHTPYFTCRAIT